jgi:hypothetical protein
MLKQGVVFLIVLVFQLPLLSQSGAWSVDSIPEELKKDAGSVIRLSEAIFTVKSPSEATLEEKFVITILHESHRNQAYFVEHFDKLIKLSNIEIFLYDKHGKLIERVAKSDIHERSVIGSGSLYDDNKIKVYDPEYHQYPFTIEYSFKRTYKGVLMYPSYATVNDYNMSLQQGKFEVRMPSGMKLRYMAKNTPVIPEITTSKDETTCQWLFQDIPAVVKESYDTYFRDLIPVVWIAPTEFEMDGYAGNAESWQSLGKWIYDLTKDRDELPESTEKEVLALTQDAPDQREKVKRLYEYMQQKTRYVNISIGIGGWQPFPAMEVEENGYGDCKALSNYMFSLLKAVDIPSYYTVIRAGEDALPIDVDFPSQQFNHVILCVPDGQDSLWLECTSQRNPFNYLGSFTENRMALLVNAEGGHLVKTPALTEVNNLRIRKALITIDGQGNAVAQVNNFYQGSFYDNHVGVYYVEGKKRMDRVRKGIHIQHFSLRDQDYSIIENRSDMPFLAEDYTLEAERFVKKMGDRLIFDVNFFNSSVDIPSAINKQHADLLIEEASTRIDSLIFVVPFGYYVKSFPENDTIDSEFGSYSSTYQLDGNTLSYVRKQISSKGIFPDEKYDDLRNYFKKINQADGKKVMVLPLE